MSVIQKSSEIMGHAIRRGGSSSSSSSFSEEENDIREESFSKFFERWVTEQSSYLEELTRTAAKANDRHTPEEDEERRVLIPLIERVKKHYDKYYRIKRKWAGEDVLTMYNPSWRSTLEDAFMWIGGWRPTMAFHLLYSKSGIQLEAGLSDVLRGFHLRNLGDLSTRQMTLVDNLQARTVQEEREITEKLAKHQETVADASMVELSHLATQLIRQPPPPSPSAHLNNNRVESTIASKEEPLVDILIKADELRLKTLKEILGILNPFQALHFLIAAAELHLRLHEWGRTRDDTKHHGVNYNTPTTHN